MRKIIYLLCLLISSTIAKAQCPPVLDLPFAGNSLDISGNNNNAIASGTPTLTANRFGNPNSAYEFGGVGDVDFFTVTNSPSLQFTNQLSISYWFKQCSFGGMNGNGQTVANGFHVPLAKAGDGFSAQPGIYFFQYVNPANNQLTWSFTNKPLYGSSPSATNFTTTAAFNCINLCEWVHVVVVVNNTNLKVYFNGIMVRNQTINTPDFAVANTKPLYIGKMDGIWYPFRGTIDDIKIYNCAISEATVASLYGGFQDPLNANVNPVFTPVGAVCSGGTINPLPTTSNNGITGTWSPALNNTQTTSYTFTPAAGQCANAASMTIQVTTTPLSPTFTLVPAICSGANLAALPTTSNNGITGTWSPAINNLATTTYTFTPATGQCATSASMTITVNSVTTPTFTQIPAICSGTTLAALPTTSNNGITGIWSPAINNLATTTYTFTPAAGQCATSASMTTTVNSAITPTFTQVPAICSGVTLAALPTTSNNGITGIWSPAINNLATTTYTFTPTNGQCTTSASMTIIVNSATSPTFTQVPAICSSATLAALPTTSNNGITGTWSPALNNTATTTYTFTPTVGQCTTSASMTIIVNSATSPTFTQVPAICSSATLAALPTTSNNGITGTWSPALNNTATTTYTFTPTVGQCANAATMTITVNPNLTPILTTSVIEPTCAETIIQLFATTTINPENYFYTWNGPNGFTSNEQNPVVNNPTAANLGNYTCTIAANTCSSAVTSSVTVSSFQIGALNGVLGTTATQLCQNGNPPVLTFTGSGGAAPYKFTFTVNGANTQTISTVTGQNSNSLFFPTANTGTFVVNLIKVELLNNPLCFQNLNQSISITVSPLPTADVTGSDAICNGGTGIFDFTGTSNAVVSFSINNGATQNITLNNNGTASYSFPNAQTTLVCTISNVFDPLTGCTSN